MRPHTALPVSMLGLALWVAIAQAPGWAAQAAEGSVPAAPAAQDPDCYLARGSMEEAAQRPSPLSETVFTLGGQVGKLCYGSPSARDRKVMGELVPFGEPWRMGANEATALHLPFPASVGGVRLEPGSFSLYAVPGPEEWEIVVNRRAERWGVPIDLEVREANMGSFKVPAGSVDEMVERLTFRWNATGPEAGTLVMEWEHTRVEIPVVRSGA
jgi:hypothetical protein